MRDYFITYQIAGDETPKTVTVTNIDADHARTTLKKVMPTIVKFCSCVLIPKKKKK